MATGLIQPPEKAAQGSYKGENAEKGDFLCPYPWCEASVTFLLPAFGVDAINTWPALHGMLNRRVRRDGANAGLF